MRQEQSAINYSAYQEQFDAKCPQWRSEPVENRKCNDVCCVVAFFILTFIFIGGGVYYLYIFNAGFLDTIKSDNELTIRKYAGQIVGCLGLSILLSFVYVLLVKIFPKIMVYTMIVLTLGLLAALIIVGIIIANYIIAISFGVTLLVYLLVLACFRKKISTGIVLIKVASNFITSNPTIYLYPVIKIVLGAIVGIFWLYVFSVIIAIADQRDNNGQSSTLDRIAAGIWVLLFIFYMFLFYYIMVFCVAVSCAFWYYAVNKNALITGYKWLFKSQFGSIVFASLLISVITFARLLADSARNNNNKNLAVAICACLLACILRELQALIKILNHNSVIVMSVTGQSFLDAAKTTIGLLSHNLPLLAISNLITGFLVLWGLLFATGFPALLVYVLLGSENQDTPAVIGIVVGLCSMLSMIVFSVLVQAVGSVYIFYCFDKKFKQLGYNVHNMPQQIYEELNDFKQYRNFEENDQSRRRLAP